LFAKDRVKPVKIDQNEALLRGLVDSHPKIPLIEQDLKKRKAGFNGEKAVDYQLSFLTDKKYMIFNDLKLPLTPHHFQIDSLLFTPHYTLILEIKNISGTLTIDSEFNQLTKNYNGTETGFLDPIMQAQRQKLFLQRFFYDHNLIIPPIEYLVVISNPNTILKMANRQTLQPPYDKIIHAQNLIREISKLNSIYTDEKVNKKELRKIKKVLLNKHDTTFTSILNTYGIKEDEIQRGVYCEICSEKMERVYGTWSCSSCKVSSKRAHEQKIDDYFLLIRPFITNKELRKFLDLESRKTAEKILNSLNLKTTGTTKGTIYHKQFH
jgi:Nuclease-related domain